MRGDGAHQHRIAVRCGLGSEVRSDIAAGARTIVDDDLLSETFSHLLAHGAREHIGSAAWAVGNDDAYRLFRIILPQQRLHACGNEHRNGKAAVRSSHCHS